MIWYNYPFCERFPHQINEHIHHLTCYHLPSFPFVKVFKFYSLNKFKYTNTVLSTIVTTLYIRYSEYIHVATEKFYPFNPYLTSPQALATRERQILHDITCENLKKKSNSLINYFILHGKQKLQIILWTSGVTSCWLFSGLIRLVGSDSLMLSQNSRVQRESHWCNSF